MFDLEKAISDWLRGLRKSPGFEDGDIEEIEDHIREEIEHQQLNGLTFKEAFNRATSSFGPLNSIGEEMTISRTKHLKISHKYSLELEFPESKNPFINSTAMFKNYIILSIRYLSRNKVFSAVNILGLAIGMATCLAIMQYVHFEMSYDTFHENGDDIYRVTLKGKSHHASNHPGTGPALKDHLPEVKEYARVVHQSTFTQRQISAWSHIDKNNDVKIFNEERVYNADPSFLTMFSFPFIYGDPQTAFLDVNSLVISESVSRKFFGLNNPIGETLIRDGTRLFTITGVFKDVPENSHIKFDILYCYFLKDAWGGGWDSSWDWEWPEYYTYIQLDPQTNIENLEAKFPNIVKQYLGDWTEQMNTQMSFHLQPLKDIHLKSPKMKKEREVHGSIKTVYFLVTIAVFILIIAWINYINLSTAKSIERAREVGFRKVAGASKKQLILQFLLESTMVNLVAILIAFIIFLFSLPYFNQLAGIKVSSVNLYSEAWFWIALGLTLILGSFLAGIYPAFVLSSFKVISVLKGKHFSSSGGILFRKLLVGFQFMISVALIAGTWMVFKQVSYMRNKDLGYCKDQILVVISPVVFDSTSFSKLQVFVNELKRYPSINSIAPSSEIPGKWIPTLNGIRNVGEDVSENTVCHYISTNHEFVNTYGLKIIAGRNFRENEFSRFSKDGITKVLVNKKTTKNLGFKNPEESVNEHILFQSGTTDWKGEIIGVVNNYHQRSLKEDYDALMFFSWQWAIPYISINLNTADIHNSNKYIEDLYKQTFPENQYEYFFQDDYFDAQYASDKQFGKVFGVFSLLAIFVASLGLFGLTTYMISRRTKEIAIRKVLGATVQQLLLLFSKDFIRLIIVANIIALPIVYYFGKNWLNNFSFRINIGWITFILPLIILLVITMVTISIQTIKTSMINPADTLKHE